MQIQIPENIDLTHAERYVLTIRIHPEGYSFSLHNPMENTPYFYHLIEKSKQVSAFLSFRNTYFDNDFFALPYRKVQVINYTPVFAYIPSLIFEDKDKDTYLDSLFLEKTGKSIYHQLQPQGITIVHEIPEEVYEFFRRSYADSRIIHHTAPVISYFQTRGRIINRNKMVVNLQNTGLDILCFSREMLLLGNHFNCNDRMDVLYYILFIWKQLQFDQLEDFLYIAGDAASEKALTESLKAYIRNSLPARDYTSGDENSSCTSAVLQTLPFEVACLSLCEF
jgi:hypothetical protein